MALIPKRPSPATVQHFRGILLLPTLAKGFHALLRKRIMKILAPQRCPGQLAGFPQQEILFGSYSLRILGATAVHQHFSIGVLFVDLAKAFHSLIREMVVGLSCSSRVTEIWDALHRRGSPDEALRAGLLPGLLATMGAPAYLVRILQNIRSASWMTIGQHGFLQTSKGTQPGSPVADAIFHFIMHDVSRCIHQFLEDEGFLVARNHLHMDVDMVIWSDDLAIPLITRNGNDLVPALLRLLDFVKSQFQQRGFQLNLSKGKTGIVTTFCGQDAPQLGKTYLLIAQQGVQHSFHDGTNAFIHFMPTYRHLGTLYTSDQKLDAEISARIGSALAAFASISARLLLNRHLPQMLRLQLFRSMILSKLYFACGSWHDPTGRQLERIRVVLV